MTKHISCVIPMTTQQIRDALEAKFEQWLDKCLELLVKYTDFTPEQAAKHILFSRSVYFRFYIDDLAPLEAVNIDYLHEYNEAERKAINGKNAGTLHSKG